MTADWGVYCFWNEDGSQRDSCLIEKEEFFIISIKQSDSIHFEDGVYAKMYIHNNVIYYVQDSVGYSSGNKELLGYVREDTARRKVFWRPKAWAGLDTTSAYLLLNYDLYQTGDTIREGVRATQLGKECGSEFNRYPCYEATSYSLSVRDVTEPFLYRVRCSESCFVVRVAL